jgi:hypothetical protein
MERISTLEIMPFSKIKKRVVDYTYKNIYIYLILKALIGLKSKISYIQDQYFYY